MNQIHRYIDLLLGNIPLFGPLILAAAGSVLVPVVLGSLWLLGRRVGKLAAQLTNRDSAISNLASELEAQALLARQMSMDLEELRKRVVIQEETGTPLGIWSSVGAPFNLNRRGQILRLSRKGKSVAEIAQDLNVAQGEVDLLLKVHDLSQKDPSKERE